MKRKKLMVRFRETRLLIKGTVKGEQFGPILSGSNMENGLISSMGIQLQMGLDELPTSS